MKEEKHWREVRAIKARRRKRLYQSFMVLLFAALATIAIFRDEVIMFYNGARIGGFSQGVANLQRLRYGVNLTHSDDDLLEQGIPMVGQGHHVTYKVSIRALRAINNRFVRSFDVSGRNFSDQTPNAINQMLIEYEMLFAQLRELGYQFEPSTLIFFVDETQIQNQLEEFGNFDIEQAITPIGDVQSRDAFVTRFMSNQGYSIEEIGQVINKLN